MNVNPNVLFPTLGVSISGLCGYLVHRGDDVSMVVLGVILGSLIVAVSVIALRATQGRTVGFYDDTRVLHYHVHEIRSGGVYFNPDNKLVGDSGHERVMRRLLVSGKQGNVPDM